MNHTAEDLFGLPADGMRHELVGGEITTMAPSGGEHGILSLGLGSAFTIS